MGTITAEIDSVNADQEIKERMKRMNASSTLNPSMPGKHIYCAQLTRKWQSKML